ncbi:MAG: PhnD/SsuA/transferrin family substrate-binding protein [Planctomycetes bacterium]|nr:PhnD/SsuA/transferrin family substrate-binding protein [Planctomycetota bacterium]
MIRTRLAMLVVGLATVLQAQRSTPSGAEQLDLTFGVYTTDRPTVVYRQFVPVLESLQDEVAAELGRPVDIQLRIFRGYEECRVALVRGEIDFARFGPASYVLAKQENPRLQLVAMEHVGGEKIFYGMIVVRADSAIRTLADLRGKRFAFGDPTSTIGCYLAQEQLLGAGLHASDLASFEFLSRHDSVFKAVEKGEFDAGSLKEGTFEKLNVDSRALRVLVRFPNVTKPWIARAGLERSVVAGLGAALRSIVDRETLEALNVDGFTTAEDSDFDIIRRAMLKSRQFDDLHPAVPPSALQQPAIPLSPGGRRSTPPASGR